MNPIKITLLTLSLLTASIGAQAAELPQSAVLQYSGSYGIPATMTFTRSGNQSQNRFYHQSTALQYPL